jgi:hypothetical protein
VCARLCQLSLGDGGVKFAAQPEMRNAMLEDNLEEGQCALKRSHGQVGPCATMKELYHAFGKAPGMKLANCAWLPFLN